MKIAETVKNVTYTNGTRIATVEQTVSRADDAEKLGNLYFRLSDIYRRLDDEGIAESERLALKLDLGKDLGKVEEEIKEYIGYLEGYGDRT